MILRKHGGALCIFAAIAAAQPRPEAGSLGVKRSIEKLQQVGSVLMIAAHPDDENTAMLAYYAKGRKYRTGYLSLTRGEGGQNLIGSEQGDLMGVIRTQELLAARRIDGAEQFFSRAIDFGFSKTAEETLHKWGREQVLGDVVWVIRKFRPDVIVLRFSGTPRDGHGQHQSSAMLGREAFAAAADPSKFPDQLRHVKPWQAKRLLWNVFTFGPAMEKEAAAMPNKLTVDVGEFDAELGLSYGELAGASRSQHRSQGMGAAERKGSMPQYLTLVAGEPATVDLFDGVDATWNRLPGGVAVAAALQEAAAAYRVDKPEAVVPALLKARAAMRTIKDPWADVKLRDIEETIAAAAGIWADFSTRQQLAVPGSELSAQTTVVCRSRVPVTYNGQTLQYNKPVTAAVKRRVEPPYTEHYWLAEPHGDSSYVVKDAALIGMPEAATPLREKFALTVAGEPVELERGIVNRYVDQVRGELTRPVVIAPPVSVEFTEWSLVFPSSAPRNVEVQVRANMSKASGTVALEAPAGWRVEPAAREFMLDGAGSVVTLGFTVTPPASASQADLKAVATVGGVAVRHGMRVIDYEHIPPQTVFRPARAAVVRTDARVLSRSVGYVMGAGDEVSKSIRQLGVDVTPLSADDLARADLSRFDAIVTGVRAYNVRDDLRANQQRLIDYVERGGTLVVQYNVMEGGPFGGGDPTKLDKLGPYPIKIGRDRVTVEETKLTPTKPDHFLLQAPNRITDSDYAGWVQERGLYFASTWDPRYTTLWESNDPGEKPSQGGTLYARHGKGVYIFTPMSWFRQLPAGVPGAYRIFANFLSAGKATQQ